MNKNLFMILIFIVVMFILFWMMPNLKIGAIGDFLGKIIVPICVAMASPSTIKNIAQIFKNIKKE